MIIGTEQDYISGKERIPESWWKRFCNGWNKFFEIEHETKEFKIFFAGFMATLISLAILATYLLLSSGAFNVN